MSTQNGQAIQKAEQHPVVKIQDLLRTWEPEIAKALPRGPLTVQRLTQVAMTCVRKTPKLQQCTGSSLVAALLQCAELGLEPGGALGRAYLVPYGDQCTLIVGYQGLIDLARRSGDLQQVEAHAVYEGDTFEVEFGLTPKLKHTPKLTGERGKAILFYCIARFRDEAVHIEVMTAAEVDAIRARSKSKDAGPWKTDPDRMGCKTVLRRAAHYWPMRAEAASLLARAFEADDQDYVDGQALDQSAVVVQGTSRTSEVKDRAKARRQIVDVKPGETDEAALARAAGEPPPDVKLPGHAGYSSPSEPPPPGDEHAPGGAQ